MKCFIILSIFICQTIIGFAQIEQSGYTRTVQHTKGEAKYINGVEIETLNTPLKSISKDGGRYSILATTVDGTSGYTLKSVKKKGYRLVDENILHKFQRVGLSDVDILLISEEEEKQLYRKIYRQLKDSLENIYLIEIKRYKGNIDSLEGIREQYEKKITSLSKIVPMLVRMDFKDASDIKKEFALALEEGNVQRIIELSSELPNAEALRNGYINYKDEYLSICNLQFHAKLLSGAFDDAVDYLLAKICADSTNVDLWLDAGDFYVKYLEDNDKAQQIYDKALSYARLHGDSSYLVAKCYLSMFKAYSFSGEPLSYSKATSIITEALSILLKTDRYDMIADAKIREGIISTGLGDHDGASNSFKLAESLLSGAPEAYALKAELYKAMARNRYEQRKYKEAVELSQKALSYCDSMPIKDNELLYSVYNDLGSYYAYLNIRFDDGISYLKKQLEICLEMYGEHHSKSAQAYLQLASAITNYTHLSKHFKKEALFYYDAALNIYNKIEGETSKNIAQLWHNKAALYYNTEEYDSAAACLLKEIDVKKKIYGDTNILIANSYEYLGSIISLKDKQAGFEYYKKALQIKKIIYNNNKQKLAESYNDFGHQYDFKASLSSKRDSVQAKEYYKIAICYYDSALCEYRKKPFNEDSLYAKILLSRGKDYLALGQIDKAVIDIEKSVKTQKNLHKKGIVEVSYKDIEILGTLYERMGKLSKAASLYTDELNNLINDTITLINLDIIYRTSHRTGYSYNYTAIITMYNHLGDIYMKKRNYKKANDSYEKAYNICCEHSNSKSLLFSCNVNMGNVLFCKKTYDSSLSFYQNALEVIKDDKYHINASVKDIENVKKQIKLCNQKIREEN